MEKQIEQIQPKRVLFLADFACASGFATVAQNIVKQLLATEKYQIDIIGINYYGLPNEWQPFSPMIRLFPATTISGGDLFGRQGLLTMLGTGAYDLLFTLQDTFIIETVAEKIRETRTKLIEAGMKKFKWIYYFPIDAEPKENWITKSAMLADYPIVYTQFGYDECIKKVPEIKTKLRIIPHGFDPKQYFPIEDKKKLEELRHEYFVGRADGKYLVTNVNRNQPRKDIARTLQIFRLFKNQVPNAVLYLHMKAEDVAGNIHEYARYCNLIPDEDYIVPKNFSEHDGVSINVMNVIYNMSDAIMTTTYGEGWGLSMTEAMACKIPVIAPNHTSLTEMLADGRGQLVTAGKRITDWVYLTNDNERKRPIVEVPEFVDKLVYLHNNTNKALEQSEIAYKYITEHITWDLVGKMWVDMFDEALRPAIKNEIGRNDPCYCGSGKKYKKCHLKYEE